MLACGGMDNKWWIHHATVMRHVKFEGTSTCKHNKNLDCGYVQMFRVRIWFVISASNVSWIPPFVDKIDVG